jgi:hypothetical protein
MVWPAVTMRTYRHLGALTIDVGQEGIEIREATRPAPEQ